MEKVTNLEEMLKLVQKPGRYIGGEWNEIRKNPYRVKTKIALIFPDLYEIGMSYLGQKILYFILNSQPSVLAERVFSPWIDFENVLRTRNIPLFSLENKIPLFKFDILGFSLLYELNYSNILTILELGQIPFFSSERGIDSPLVIAGGYAVFNPEPVADIFDLFLIGDGEEAFLEIVEKFNVLKDESKEKGAVLKELAKIKGVYVPSLYTPYQPHQSSLLAVKPSKNSPRKVSKRVLSPFDSALFPENIVVPNIKAIFDRVSVEVARGCPQKCRFCQAVSVYFPSRVKNPNFVLQKVLNSLHSTGYEDASLASLSVSDYPYLGDTIGSLMKVLEEKKVSLSLPSLRPKGLTAEVAESIIRVRKTGFTLVPEAGTERLRCVINKNLKDSDIWEASNNAFSQGWRLLKLYFMVGLPTEKDEDLEGIVHVVKEIIRIGHAILKKSPQINLSISSFIPKPHTPFQWLKMEDEKALKEKHRFLKSRLKKYASVRPKVHPIKNSILEAIFSRGDRRLTPILLQSWKNGARFDGWNDRLNFSIWERAFDSKSVNYNLYLSSLDRAAVLPWEHIDTGIKKSHLLLELDKALKEEPTVSCLEEKCGECQGCSLWPLYEKDFSEKVHISPKANPLFGRKTKNIIRYRVCYEKLRSARFLSHIDLNNIIQRGFRRAGISVVHSAGFHPKMMISYPPALPLGMAGNAEMFEFKSLYRFSSKAFISHVNKFLPSGVRFLRLWRRSPLRSSLSKEIKSLVYSVDLEQQEIREALEKIQKEKEISGLDDSKIVEKLIRDYKREFQNGSIEKLKLDKELKKLYIYVKFSPQKIGRPQEVMDRIFGIKNPIFLMAREKIIFK